MQELFWVIIGYTVVLTVCFLLGEYLQNRRRTKKYRRAKKIAPPFSDNSCL